MSFLLQPNIKFLKARREIQELIKALSYPSSAQIRHEAAKALGEIGDRKAVEPLIEKVKLLGSDWIMTANSAEALGQIGDVRAVEALITVRVAGLGSEAGGEAYKAAEKALIRLGPDAVEPLIALLKQTNANVRRMSANALGKIGDPRAIAPLIEMLPDRGSEGWVSAEASSALEKIGPQAINPLIAALLTSDEYTCKAIIKLLGKMKDKQAVAPLIDVLKTGQKGARYYALRALEDIGDPRAIDALNEVLSDGDDSMRRAAAMALENLKARNS
jgi:HEAT repeat protein